MSDFKVEKGLRIPAARARYPFAEMAVGDSFLVPQTRAHWARSAAQHWGAEHGVKFTTRSVNGGVRIWRVK